MRLKRWESALVDRVNAKDLEGLSYRRVKMLYQIENCPLCPCGYA